MKKVFSLILLAIIICFLNGCASVSIYSGSDLTKKTGLRFYTVKPYLLVELKAEKDNTVKTSIVYLPDLVNPQYLIFKPGIGSNELKMAFTNGSLNSYGLTTESQIPETINALAGLVSKSTGVVGQIAQQAIHIEQVSTEPNFRLYEIVIGDEGTSLKEVTVGEK
jgi:hypothetical protein